MDFWQEYNEHCLQSPWVIAPNGTGVEIEDVIPSGRAFVFNPSQSDSAYSMMSKMVTALKLDPDQIQLLEDRPELIENIECLNAKKIVFFGDQFPGAFGEALHWAGHQVVKTHSLEDLLTQPDLKKQTWEHLKMFARLP